MESTVLINLRLAQPKVLDNSDTEEDYNNPQISSNTITFKLGNCHIEDEDDDEEEENEAGRSNSDANRNDEATKHGLTGSTATFHSSESSESLYSRRRKQPSKIVISTPDEQNEKEGSGSRSPPDVQYNIFLNVPKENFEPPKTPSVADVVQLKYRLSPEIIKEKTENEFNFVFPPPKNSSEEVEDKCDDVKTSVDTNSVTPLKYHLVNLCTIGKGSFGRVFLARHRLTGQFYALKAMSIPAIIEKHQVDHVHNEKRILQQLDHPFIVKLFDTAKDKCSLYMILEYLPGGELFSYFRMSKKFTSPVVKFYAAEVILALDYLHAMFIAFRDLKPENLMLTEDGHVKLTDFGFAKKIHNKSYTLCGTSEYLAPEVIQRRGHGLTVDCWALGVLIYELMAGHTPFGGQDVDEVLESILAANDIIEFPRKTFSDAAKDLIAQLLRINPRQRLGANSIESIKNHEWFKNCDWQAVYDKTIIPPLIPTIYYEGDTGNFDSYDESVESQAAKQRDLDLFDEW